MKNVLFFACLFFVGTASAQYCLPASDANFIFDCKGKLVTISKKDEAIQIFWNRRGQITDLKSTKQGTITIVNNPNGTMHSVSSSVCSIVFKYDTTGNMYGITDPCNIGDEVGLYLQEVATYLHWINENRICPDEYEYAKY